MNPGPLTGDQASSFLVTKHSWKGKYRRVLTLSQDGFSTYNPNSMEVTNTWKIGDVVGLNPAPSTAGGPPQTPGAALEFQLVFRKGKKTDSMRFSSEWRSTILTEALRLLQKSGNDTGSTKVVIHLCGCLIFLEEQFPALGLGYICHH